MRHRPPTPLRDAPTSRRIARSLSSALLASVVAAGASALPAYEITPLGLADAEHTRNDGYRSGTAALHESGLVFGGSERFAGGTASLGWSSWLYDPSDQSTTRLGLLDAAHTRADGYRTSGTNDITGAGTAVGVSWRYSGMTWLGQSAWIYDPSDDSTTQLGFVDAVHTRSDGYQTSETEFLTESGYAAGNSQRYDGTSLDGNSSWVYDTSDDSFTRLGFFDAAHTRSDGRQDTSLFDFTESGYAAGTSSFYDGSANLGLSTWFYDANYGSTTRIGFFDATHTSSGNQQFSFVSSLTASGYATGTSRRYGGASFSNQSAWLYDANDDSTTRLGFFDAAHTRTDGTQTSTPLHLTESGYAAGSSRRYSGATLVGESAWLHDANDGSTTRLGFFDATHTGTDGYQTSTANHLTESGYAAGTSLRLDGATVTGTSAWIYDSNDGSTTRAGLLDAAHTGSSGQQYSNVTFLVDTGYAVGFSEHHTGVIPSQSVWLYDPADDSSTRIGLFDALHTRSDGFQYSLANFLTESGYAAGYSDRNTGAGTGRSGWVYDASDRSLDGIILSQRSDGSAWTSISFLGEDGLALGAYQLFDTNDTYLGYRAFAWTPDGGAVDLGALVVGGLAAANWAHLAEAIRANGLGTIIGRGSLLSGGELAYLLLPVPIPEPGTGLLLSAGLLGLAMKRGRHTRGH